MLASSPNSSPDALVKNGERILQQELLKASPIKLDSAPLLSRTHIMISSVALSLIGYCWLKLSAQRVPGADAAAINEQQLFSFHDYLPCLLKSDGTFDDSSIPTLIATFFVILMSSAALVYWRNLRRGRSVMPD